jgi:outer membrane protein assembly factor BamB
MTRLAALSLVVFVTWSACSPPDVPPGGGGGLPDPSTLRIWSNDSARAYSRPLVAGQAVYFLTAGTHDVSAVDKTAGKLLWKTHLTLPNPVLGGFGLAMAGGHLIVGDSELFGLDPATGAIVFHFVPSAGRHCGYQRLTSDASTAYCGAGGGYVFAVDGATGAERWKAKITADTNVDVINPVLDQGAIYVGFNDLQVHPGPFVSGRIFGGVSAIEASSGRVLWTTLLPHPDSTIPSTTQGVLVSNGRVIAGSSDGTLYALDPATGAIVQSVPRTQFITATPPPSDLDQKVFAASGTTLLVGSLFGTLSAWSISDLRRLWIVYIEDHGSVIDLVADQDFVYATYVGGQFSVSRVVDGKFAWLIDAAALRDGFTPIAAAPALDGNRLYLGGFQASYAMKKN